MKTERSRWEIIFDILNVTREEKKVKRTQIMYRANLEWRNFNRYFDFLQAEGFITKCNPEPDCYELTEKGKNLLYKLKELCQVLEKDRRNTSIMSRIFAVRQKQVNLFKHQSNSLPILIMSSIMYLMNSKSHIF